MSATPCRGLLPARGGACQIRAPVLGRPTVLRTTLIAPVDRYRNSWEHQDFKLDFTRSDTNDRPFAPGIPRRRSVRWHLCSDVQHVGGTGADGETRAGQQRQALECAPDARRQAGPAGELEQ